MKAETGVGFTLAWGEFSFLPGKPGSRLAITVMHPEQGPAVVTPCRAVRYDDSACGEAVLLYIPRGLLPMAPVV